MILRTFPIYASVLFALACSDRSNSARAETNNGDSATIETFFKTEHETQYQEADKVFKLVSHNSYLVAKIYKRAIGPLVVDTVVLKQDPQTGLYLLHAPSSTWFKLSLPDKTIAWLNSESSIAFPGDMSLDRHVTLSGEACFNVQKSSRPFVIKIDGSRIDMRKGKVNVTAYPASYLQTATIESGNAVIRSEVDSAEFIGPNCVQWNSGRLMRLTHCDPDISLSWTKGFLMIDPNEKWEQFLARMKRWYGVRFTYQGADVSPLEGKLPASASIKQFLDVMRVNNIEPSFEIENGKLTVVLTQTK